MPKLSKALTDSVARAVVLPAPLTARRAKPGASIPPSTSRHEYWWCPKTPGFGLRVSSSGDKAYIFERRVEGKTVRRTLGKAVGPGAISAKAAEALQIEISSELQKGEDRVVDKREERKLKKQEAVLLDDAIKAYVKGKRRGKDGLPLKDRTKADYLAMVAAGKTRTDGTPFSDGPLFKLAKKSITKITAADMRAAYKAAEAKSLRRAIYAMQVLRAVLNWHGIAVEDSPLAKSTAGKDRIILAGTAGKPRPIPPERLGAWWNAAIAKSGGEAADGCRLILLTGCRPGEIFGSEHEKGLLVRNVDLPGARFTLIDTKNRRDHVVMLSTQALDIVKAHCEKKEATDKVFDVLDPGKTLVLINKEAEVVGITAHKLRHTFASVAEELVSSYSLKAMMNHTDGADVTGSHYVGKSENQLRAAWQSVADFVEKSAG